MSRIEPLRGRVCELKNYDRGSESRRAAGAVDPKACATTFPRRQLHRTKTLIYSRIRWDCVLGKAGPSVVARRQGPIHRRGFATLGGAMSLHWSEPARSTADLNLSARDDLTALEAKSFVIERLPFSVMVEMAEGVELVREREPESEGGYHTTRMTFPRRPTIGRQAHSLIG